MSASALVCLAPGSEETELRHHPQEIMQICEEVAA